MATRNITTRIALDGEQEFKRQMSSVNSELRTQKSEMQLLEAQFKGQLNTTEALTEQDRILRAEIEQQQEKVKALAQAVVDASAAYGDADKRTDGYRQSLNRAQRDLIEMNRELEQTEKYLKEAGDSADGTASSIDGFGREVRNTSEPLEEALGSLDEFKQSLGTFKDMFVGGAIVKGIKEVGDAVLELEESTREYRQIIGTLETSAQQAGYSADETQAAYSRLYGVLGDAQTTATTVANLQAIGLEQDSLMTLIDQTVGAWGRYGDSIPIDGLAEAINETIKAGQVTGTFADVLNWGSRENETFGVTMKDNIEFTELSKKELDKLTESQRKEYEATKEQYDAIQDYNQAVADAETAEDKFNIALANCETQAERTDLVLQTMAQMGLAEAGESWRDLNEDIVNANESQHRMEEAMGRLGEAISPAADAIRNTAAGAIEYFAGVVENAITLVQGFLGWWDKFNNTKEARDNEQRRTKQRTGVDIVVAPDTSGYANGGNDNSAWSSVQQSMAPKSIMLDEVAWRTSMQSGAPAQQTGVSAHELQQITAAAVNAINLNRGQEGGSYNINLMLPDNTTWARYQLPSLIEVANANGTPILNPQNA